MVTTAGGALPQQSYGQPTQALFKTTHTRVEHAVAPEAVQQLQTATLVVVRSRLSSSDSAMNGSSRKLHEVRGH